MLVVDDTEGNRYATSRILRGCGFDVIEADTGARALQITEETQPDLLVLAVNLPDMTGFEVVKRLRELSRVAATPVLHLSASNTANSDRARGPEETADAYLTHPIDPVVFLATVRSLLRAGAADRRLEDAVSEWQTTFDALNDVVLLLDEQAIVRRANKAACVLLARRDEDILGHSLGALLERQFIGESHDLIDRLLTGHPMDKALFALGARSYLVTTAPVNNDAPESRTVCVLEEVSERLSAAREREALLLVAEDARHEAEAANQAKNEFLAVMSHELRTPLNAIGGYAQLIELGIRGPVTAAQHADLDRIKRSQTYLLSLINDVLNFAKIEAGHLHVEAADVDIGPLVLGMRDFVQPQLQEQKLTFTCECPASVHVCADADKVQQILINLLSNALKFTPSGGTIAMQCDTSEDDVLISVCDTGRGIAADKLESIFEPFVQVDRRYLREREGIGLGLAISRELARAMGGDLTVSSSMSTGSVFMLKLGRDRSAMS